ncbi:hypothetical protein I2485_03110 [Nesterenkonia sp. E16_7]|uniref:hypothetical protein n=1 Tax=unclassified Nesterenkonia TaxID=2629769 RepID=UPI001A931736|nr:MULTISPECIES: hypothetical protein [unclassified Nesterenkonia]MBO0594192.1 hypothetical protein [Nesterenkonia sp. E16_10]MBO0597638.1 hypothetical protein [Nesterenkonia sp. E16_7]
MTAEQPEQDPRTHPTRPLPPEPADVDELLAESLRAQSERDFTWKEPERGPRWFERAEQEAALSAGTVPPTGTAAAPAAKGPLAATSGGADSVRGPRISGAIYAAIAVALALWVLASIVLGIYIDWLIVALGVFALAGLALVATGLMPKPGSRL